MLENWNEATKAIWCTACKGMFSMQDNIFNSNWDFTIVHLLYIGETEYEPIFFIEVKHPEAFLWRIFFATFSSLLSASVMFKKMIAALS